MLLSSISHSILSLSAPYMSITKPSKQTKLHQVSWHDSRDNYRWGGQTRFCSCTRITYNMFQLAFVKWSASHSLLHHTCISHFKRFNQPAYLKQLYVVLPDSGLTLHTQGVMTQLQLITYHCLSPVPQVFAAYNIAA